MAAAHHHGLQVEDDVAEGAELRVEVDQPRALALAAGQVGAELHVLARVTELAAELAEEVGLALALVRVRVEVRVGVRARVRVSVRVRVRVRSGSGLGLGFGFGSGLGLG